MLYTFKSSTLASVRIIRLFFYPVLDNNLWHIDLREPLSLFNLAYSCEERDRQINEYVALESINAC